VWRIVCLAALAAGTAYAQTASPQSAAAPLQGQGDAVSVILMIRNDALTTLDLAFPGVVTMSDINSDLAQITRWAGWTLSTPEVEAVGGVTSVHVAVTEAVPAGAILNDMVWPLVAALAPHGRLGITVMGIQVSTAPQRVDNRYVTLEQRGGQGVQYYDATVKDTGFRNLEELRRAAPAAPPSGLDPAQRLGLGWLLVLVASVASGLAVYLIMSRLPASRQGARSPRRRN
jgi:hypothetical protein